MIDLDLYLPDERVEKFLDLLKVKRNKDYPSIKVYISSAGLNDNWLLKQYIIYNEDKYGSD